MRVTLIDARGERDIESTTRLAVQSLTAGAEVWA